MSNVAIDVQESKVGNILAEDIFNKYGAIVVTKYTTLNTYIINKLYNFEIKKVKIFESEYNCDNIDLSVNTKKSYLQKVVLIKEIMNEIITKEKLNIKKIKELSESVYSEIKQDYNIMRCINEIRNADEYTYHHCVNVAFYAALIGKWLKLCKADIINIIKSGLLHDIGKIKIPNEIINKRGKLLPEEYEEIKRHCIYGFNILKSMETIESDIKSAVLMHHEREDASGYPFGHKGSQMTLYSKIIAIADVYDAMTSKRVYGRKATPFEAFDMFMTEGIKLFDSEITNVFLKRIMHFYVGLKVMLNTGETAEVVYIPLHCITKPIVKIGEKYIDLNEEKDYIITACCF